VASGPAFESVRIKSMEYSCRPWDIVYLYKHLEKYQMKYKVILEESDEGFAVSVPGLPGCHSQGATEQEALENIADAIREYLEVVAELNRNKVTREVEV
jgi:predicted RNase H-like HicB family nuclease